MKLKLILLITISLFITSCADNKFTLKKEPTQESDIQGQAEQQVLLNNNKEAAQLYLSLAQSSKEPLRTTYLLKAAENFLSAQLFSQAEKTIKDLDGQNLNLVNDFQRRLIKADIALNKKQAYEIIDLLSTAAPESSNNVILLRQHQLLAFAYQLSGNLLDSAYELTLVDSLETNLNERLATQMSILRSLMPLSDTALTQLQPSPPGIQGGWMSLALIIKQSNQTPEELREQINQWRIQFHQHPAMPALFEHLIEVKKPAENIRQIAILLPETGPLEKVANAVRQGFIAAWYQTAEENRPLIRFYDTATEKQVWPAYNQAISDGASVVIGPLQKNAVLQFARAGELPIPVLALNKILTDTELPPNLYQYSLSPEDEAKQVADKAWQEGKHRPLILYPEGDRGRRIKNAFSQRWLELTEVVAGEESYNTKTSDFSAPIKSLMQINQSLSRNKQLQRVLGKKLKFEPRIREDVDFIFLISRARQTKEIKPQLQFHYAGDIPVYSISQAWNGKLSEQDAPDFSGITLPDIPWLLVNDHENPLSQYNLKKIFPDSGGNFARLYAMGIDSFNLIHHLQRLKSSRFETLDGKTGNLYMDSENNIHRQLVWVTLGKKMKILGYSPRLDLFTSEGTENNALFVEEEPKR